MILCILSDHNEIELKVNSKQISSNNLNSQTLNNTLLNEEWVKEKIKIELRIFVIKRKQQHHITKPHRYIKNSSKREVYSPKNLHSKNEKPIKHVEKNLTKEIKHFYNGNFKFLNKKY